jgi:hypothetical protein
MVAICCNFLNFFYGVYLLFIVLCFRIICYMFFAAMYLMALVDIVIRRVHAPNAPQGSRV